MIITSFMAVSDNGRIDPIESDYYSQAFIPKKVQKFDFELFATKWFDYRHLTPLEATLAYIDAFGVVYRRVYAQQMDAERAQHMNLTTGAKVKSGLISNNSKIKRNFTGYWRGRQIADALCMPYELYIELAIDYRMRHWQRAHLPRPEHLYHEWDVEKVQDRWIELQSASLYLSEHPAYMTQNYAGTAAQNDYHEWLFKQANLRSNRTVMLARFVKEGVIQFDKVISRLSDAELNDFEYYLDQT
jgi:hypothetical protein